MFGRKEIREQFYRLKKRNIIIIIVMCIAQERMWERKKHFCVDEDGQQLVAKEKKKRISSQIFLIFLFENFPNIYRTLNRGNVLKFVTFMLLSSLLRKTFALRSQTHHKLYICHSLKNKEMLIDTLIYFGH